MRVWILGSGSRGNAILVRDAHHTVLVDAGFPLRSLEARLAVAGVRPGEVSALLLTHGHGDHTHAAASGQRRWGWPVYATRGTVLDTPALYGREVHEVHVDQPFALGGFRVEVAATTHDARDAVAFALTGDQSGGKVAIVTDTGTATDGLRALAEHADLLVLEANHDPAQLATCRYPESVKMRIGGPLGHLSNAQAAAFLGDTADEALAGIVLAHLSETANTPATAHRTVLGAARAAGYAGELWCAPQDAVLGPFGVAEAATPTARPVHPTAAGTRRTPTPA